MSEDAVDKPKLEEEEGEKKYEEAAETENLKYPYQIFVIILNEAFSMFSWYGMKTILQLYLMQELKIPGHYADSIQHSFAAFYYLMTPVAGNIADSYLGRYWTIVAASAFYVIGHLVLSSSDLPGITLSTALILTIVALVIVSFGQGGMKATVASFGAQQFKLPQQEKQMAKYFSVFYLMINVGAFLGQLLVPILRSSVACFGKITCYPLAFGIPAIFAVLTAVSFIVGTPWYNYAPPAGNAFCKCLGCMSAAVYNRLTGKATEKHSHWLDYAQYSGYEKSFIFDAKIVMSMLMLSIPVPFYWALYDQNATKWIRQSLDMNTHMGGGWYIDPDHMLSLNPILIMIFLPLFSWVLYPYLDKIKKMHTNLQKMTVGVFLMAIAFVATTVIQYIITAGLPEVPSETQTALRLVSVVPGPLTVFLVGPATTSAFFATSGAAASFDGLDPGAAYTLKAGSVDGATFGTFTGTPASTFTGVISGDASAPTYIQATDPVMTEESDGTFIARIIHNFGGSGHKVSLNVGSTIAHDFGTLAGSGISAQSKHLTAKTYSILVDGKVVKEESFETGGEFCITLNENPTAQSADIKVAAARPANKVHILWQAVMYVLAMFSELLFSPIGLELFYTEAPESMKSFLTGWWYALSGLGQLVIVVISAIDVFPLLWHEFLFYTVLIIIVTGVFAAVAHFYVYKKDRKDSIMEEVEKTEGGETEASAERRKSEVLPDAK